jgi:CMP/dCMP kinase
VNPGTDFLGAGAPVLAIDGPGGSGKGTVSRAVAAALEWHWLDSGALYRAVALAAQREGVPWTAEVRLATLALKLPVRFAYGAQGDRVWLGQSDVTDEIRSEASGQGASAVAAIPAVRAALVQRQRAFRRVPGLVADGRDMGTAIFPDAGLKVFLTASVEERARRRHNQLKEKGIDVSLPALSEDMAERDRRDSERTASPLRPSPEAHLLDSTGLPVEAVVAQVLRWAAEVWPKRVLPGRF